MTQEYQKNTVIKRIIFFLSHNYLIKNQHLHITFPKYLSELKCTVLKDNFTVTTMPGFWSHAMFPV